MLTSINHRQRCPVFKKQLVINQCLTAEMQGSCCGKSIPEEIKLHLTNWYIHI